MSDRTPSDMDDLFDIALTPSTTEPGPFPSRRAAREASGSNRSVSKRRARAAVRSARARAELSRPASDRRAIARATRDSVSSTPASRKLRRDEVASVRASTPKSARKNPLSVLVTMVAVTGMFAVAGLPAYALTTEAPLAAKKTTAETDTQSMFVGSQSSVVAPTRDGYRATTPQQLAEMSKDSLRAQNNAEYLASGARELGDDYPWPYELATFQGGGLSPLNYFYRECVDFVAWRLNRDAGSFEEPFKWVWSTLTPTGGNAYQWKYAWEKQGWTVSSTPVVGSVAWFSSNHVAYVKQVLEGGSVLIEEYNYTPGVYGQRTLSATEVDAFLYPPT